MNLTSESKASMKRTVEMGNEIIDSCGTLAMGLTGLPTNVLEPLSSFLFKTLDWVKEISHTLAEMEEVSLDHPNANAHPIDLSDIDAETQALIQEQQKLAYKFSYLQFALSEALREQSQQKRKKKLQRKEKKISESKSPKESRRLFRHSDTPWHPI